MNFDSICRNFTSAEPDAGGHGGRVGEGVHRGEGTGVPAVVGGEQSGAIVRTAEDFDGRPRRGMSALISTYSPTFFSVGVPMSVLAVMW